MFLIFLVDTSNTSTGIKMVQIQQIFFWVGKPATSLLPLQNCFDSYGQPVIKKKRITLDVALYLPVFHCKPSPFTLLCSPSAFMSLNTHTILLPYIWCQSHVSARILYAEEEIDFTNCLFFFLAYSTNMIRAAVLIHSLTSSCACQSCRILKLHFYFWLGHAS